MTKWDVFWDAVYISKHLDIVGIVINQIYLKNIHIFVNHCGNCDTKDV